MHVTAWIAILILAKLLQERNLVPVKINEMIKVLDVGSQNVNGVSRTALELEFNQFHYTGLDIESGPNVDVVYNSSSHDSWPFINQEFDLV